MTFSRRSLLGMVPTGLIVGVSARQAFAASTPSASTPASSSPAAAPVMDPEAERFIGKPDAPVRVDEYFSMTCPHCAAFSKDTLPEIKKNLIDTGKLKWVFHDFPLDKVALTASMVARYLPVDRYAPFVDALFATQLTWAYGEGTDTTKELWKMAALAGMSRPTFDKAIHDTKLQDWILAQQKLDSQKLKIDSTPSFIIDGRKYSGDMDYAAFRKLIPVQG